MKFVLVLCAVISLAVGFPSEEDFDVTDVDWFDSGLPISEEQIQCIKDGVQKIIDDNPELKWWFDEVEKAVTKLSEGAKKCDALTGIQQKRCYLKLKIAAQIELRRLIKLLPEDQREVLETLKDIIKGCLES